jgi:hypothetical protein
MVKYQDTAAYKKATDEQLRLRDALEKEVRQREADKNVLPVRKTDDPPLPP